MKSGITPKSLALLFPIVLVAYLGVFFGLEHLRHRKGAWQVDFNRNEQGEPMVIIRQPSLGVHEVKLVFRGEQTTNQSGHVSFDRVQQPVPFGTVIYEDLTFLPGVVTFDFFGHEVEFLPRVLIVNKREVPWKSGSVIELSATNKPPTPPRPAKGYE